MKITISTIDETDVGLGILKEEINIINEKVNYINDMYDIQKEVSPFEAIRLLAHAETPVPHEVIQKLARMESQNQLAGLKGVKI